MKRKTPIEKYTPIVKILIKAALAIAILSELGKEGVPVLLKLLVI